MQTNAQMKSVQIKYQNFRQEKPAVFLPEFLTYRARLKGASYVALILFLALPGCSLANSRTFLPISVV